MANGNTNFNQGMGGVFGQLGAAVGRAAVNPQASSGIPITAESLGNLLDDLGVGQLSTEEQAFLDSLPTPETREATAKEAALLGIAPTPSAEPTQRAIVVEMPAPVKPVEPAKPVSPVEPKKAEESKKEEEVSPFVFTEFEKLKAADALVNPTEPYVYEVKFNKLLTVGFKSASETEQAFVNSEVQRAIARGIVRRVKSRVDAYDIQGRPISQDTEEDRYDSADQERHIRFMQLLVGISHINFKALPADMVERKKFLETYSAHILNIIYEKGYIKFVALMKEVKDNFENF